MVLNGVDVSPDLLIPTGDRTLAGDWHTVPRPGEKRGAPTISNFFAGPCPYVFDEANVLHFVMYFNGKIYVEHLA